MKAALIGVAASVSAVTVLTIANDVSLKGIQLAVLCAAFVAWVTDRFFEH